MVLSSLSAVFALTDRSSAVKLEQLLRTKNPELRWRPLAIGMHILALPTSVYLCYKNLVRTTCCCVCNCVPFA